MLKTNALCSSLIVMLSFGCTNNNTPMADLLVINANIITMDDANPQASQLAVGGDIILAVGDSAEVNRYRNDKTKILDVKGKTVIPGLIESHAHFFNLGYLQMRLYLQETRNWDEVLAMVAQAVKETPEGTWIIGRGWHQEKWDRLPSHLYEGFPSHEELSAVSPNHPVYLDHASGHAVIANALAMKIAAVSAQTQDPAGGHIVRMPDGSPSGVFIENAEDLIIDQFDAEHQKLTPDEIEEEWREVFTRAQQACLQHGITSFHDAGAAIDTIRFYQKMLQQDMFRMRLWVMIGDKNEALRENITFYKSLPRSNRFLNVRAIKRYIDGAMGTRSAWLLEPYADQPGTSGLQAKATEYLRESAQLAMENGFQLCTHAIGDRGNRETLDLYEETFASQPSGSDFRWRIEHAQHLDRTDLSRFKQLGVIAAIQANHCTSDGPWVPQRIGAVRSKSGAYMWQDLMSSGAVICNGTDAPVEDVNPFKNFYSAITRMMASGETFYPDQKMTRRQALAAYTKNGAYASFEEDIKGSLVRGKLADIAVLSDDIMTVAAEKIPEIEVLYTIVGGKIVYRKEAAPGI